LELTLRFFSFRDVFAEKGTTLGASSFMSTSRSGVLRRDAVGTFAASLGLEASSSLNRTGDRAPGGDESGVEYGPVNLPRSEGSCFTLLFFVLAGSSNWASKS
jgi:hypothetical protein